MPNTRADLERLKAERWAVGPGGPRAGVYVELLAIADRLLGERDDFAVALTVLKDRIEGEIDHWHEESDSHARLTALLNPEGSNEDAD